jgi:hypothetical protein
MIQSPIEAAMGCRVRPLARCGVAGSLSRLRPRIAEAEAKYGVVQAHLQQPEQRIAGDAAAADGFAVVAAELRLHETVGDAGALLFA